MNRFGLSFHLGGKALVVIGGGHGVGPQVVLGAAQRGAEVVYCEHGRDQGNAAALVAAAGAAGRVHAIPADLSCEDGVDRFFDAALEALGGFHAFIHNLEGGESSAAKPLLDTTLDDWNAVMASHLRQPFLTARRAVGDLLAGGVGGRIVLIVPTPSGEAAGPTSYASAHSALYALMRSLAKEYGARGIACNGVALPARLGSDAPVLQEPTGPGPSLSIEHVARAAGEVALFLVSDAAAFVNGEMVHLRRPTCRL